MAALRPCPARIITSCPANSSDLRRSRWTPRAVLPLQQRSNTTRKISHRIRAHKGGADQPPVNPDDPKEDTPEESMKGRWEELPKLANYKGPTVSFTKTDTPFREDMDRIEGYWDKMGGEISLLYLEGRSLSRHLCLCARTAVGLASHIVNCAARKLDMPSEFSKHSIKLTLQMYVKIFVSTAEDSYNKKVRMETIVSCLGALQGVAAISHIMVKDTLANCTGLVGTTGDNGDKESVSTEVDRIMLDYQLEMNRLKGKFSAAKPLDACKLVGVLLTDALRSTARCVWTMVDTCKWALRGHVPGASTSRPAPDDAGGEPDK